MKATVYSLTDKTPSWARHMLRGVTVAGAVCEADLNHEQIKLFNFVGILLLLEEKRLIRVEWEGEGEPRFLPGDRFEELK